MKDENVFKNKVIIILLFILAALLFLSCVSNKHYTRRPFNNYADDLYYNPNDSKDSIVNTYYGYQFKYYPIYHYSTRTIFNNYLYDISFDPYWLENYLMYPGYFQGLNQQQIYFSLRSYGFDAPFSNYYAYNYNRYFNRYPYNSYRQRIRHYNKKTNGNHRNIVRKPRKSFNSTYKQHNYNEQITQYRINNVRGKQNLNAEIPVYKIHHNRKPRYNTPTNKKNLIYNRNIKIKNIDESKKGL